jgi:DNA-binding beta-propeller fold protein YncE
VRSGALRAGPAWPGGAGQAALARLGTVVQARPGRRGGSVLLGGSPGNPVANPKTGTVYVPIQCATSFCPASGKPGHVVDVINAARCSTKVISDCRVVATARVGTSPLAAAVDERTDTVYVVNGTSNTVSVLDGAMCNANLTRGCGRPVATVKVGKFPVAAAVNPVTRTLYVADLGAGTISVINAATCNAQTTRGCRRPARTVPDKAGPDWLGVDTATNTVYAANSGSQGGGDTVSVIDGAACTGHTGRGCGRIAATVTVGTNPFALAVDQASDTVYVANFVNDFNDGSVSVINGARCNARVTSGCHRMPAAVRSGIGPGFVAVDRALHTVFAVNAGDDTLSAINTRTCDGAVASGCHKRPPSQQATPLQGPGYNSFANAFALIPRTGSTYVVNVGGANILSVTSINRCNAANTTGCRDEAPAVPEGESLLSADPATDTIYASNLSKPQIDVINGATCHSRDLTGCAPVAEIPVADPGANVGAIDEATHTLYAADEAPSGTLAVIDTATCNATDTTGCAAAPPSMKIGAFPSPPVFNPATKTVYLSYGNTGNRVAIVNAATCNATDTSGCGQAPAVVKVGTGTFFGLAVSEATDTIYGPNAGLGFTGDTMSVINGATCNGTDHSGCGHLAATVKVGPGPAGVVVNDRTHTVYVVNNANGDSPGTVSVINGATCNATIITGCSGPFPTAATGNSPLFIAADTRTGTLYVTNFSSASVTILNGTRCNAAVTSGCSRATREQAVGSGPGGLAINPRTHTAYIANGYLPGSMSIFRVTRH